MEKTIYSEEEAIIFCIENKVRNSEKRLMTFSRLGKLDGKDSINSLTNDLLLFYNKVNLGLDGKGKVLKGTKRTYECEDLRDVPLEKAANHVGTQVAKDQDIILKEYVFNRLCEILKGNHSDTHSITIWSDVIGICYTTGMDYQAIREMFNDYYFIAESKRVTSSLIRRLSERNREAVELAFNQLYKEDRIQKEDVFFSTMDKTSKVITVEEYEAIKQTIKTEVQSLGMDYKTYVWLKRNSTKANSNQLKVIEQVKNKLLDTYGIDGTFKAYGIKVTNRKKYLEVSREMMLQAYFEKLVALTERNLKMSNKEKQTGFVEKEFAAFNMFLLIHYHLGELDLEERLMELLPTKDQIQEVQEIHRQYGIVKANREAERIANSETFLIED